MSLTNLGDFKHKLVVGFGLTMEPLMVLAVSVIIMRFNCTNGGIYVAMAISVLATAP